MTEKKTFHWRDIRTSAHLQRVAAILKDADRPLSGLEVQDEAMRRGFRIVNPGTDIGEIGQNPGYGTSGGVRFRDGKYRYWLTVAPGWTPRWRVNRDFHVIPWNDDEGPGASRQESSGTLLDPGPCTSDPEVNYCPICGAKTDEDFCSDEHKKDFFNR